MKIIQERIMTATSTDMMAAAPVVLDRAAVGIREVITVVRHTIPEAVTAEVLVTVQVHQVQIKMRARRTDDNQKQMIKVLTKGEITKSALTELKLRGANVWAQNNLAVPGRKFIGRKGVSDIIGFNRVGLFVACEVKTINDTFSADQIVFMNDIKKSGGIALIATQEFNQVVLKDWDLMEHVNHKVIPI